MEASQEGPRPKDLSFSVGICAAGSPPELADTVSYLLKEAGSVPGRFDGLVVVASACPPSTVRALERLAASEPKLSLVTEPERRGKSQAVNRIAESVDSDALVLVNSDALPERGAIGKLMACLSDDMRAGVVSAAPLIEDGRGPTSLLLQLMWSVHNATLLRLNHEGTSNHASDELMAVRMEAFRHLPPGTVNDGALMGGMARRMGFSVRFMASARVKIDTPARLVDLIRQRRRIIFGHFRVNEATGHLPRTVETMMLTSPRTGVGFVIEAIAKEPKLLLALPFAAMTELAATAGALSDLAMGSRRHEVWSRYAGAT